MDQNQFTDEQLERLRKAEGGLGECLECGRPGTEEEPTKRGLCRDDYNNWYYLRSKIKSEEGKKAFDKKMVSLGKLLPTKGENPFLEIAAEFLEESPAVKEVAKASKKLEERQAKKKKPAPPIEKLPESKPEQTKGRR